MRFGMFEHPQGWRIAIGEGRIVVSCSVKHMNDAVKTVKEII